MKRIFLKSIIMVFITSSVAININSIEANAAWSKNSQNKWMWIENNTKATGWKKINGLWYYFYSDGIMATNWLKDGSSWYYLNNSGSMKTGWLKDGSSWYYLNGSGKMQVGWLKCGTTWYYLNDTGSMLIGWQNIKGKKYYFDESGTMVTGDITINDKTYHFDKDGALVENESNLNKPINDKEESKKAYVVTESVPLNLRESPSTASKVIGQIPKHSEILVIGTEKDGFYKVVWNKLEGYASSSWISFNKPISDSLEGSNSSDKNENVTLGSIRTTAPEDNNKYYYSDDNIFYLAKLSPPFSNSSGNPIIGNCTWYAWGRIWEMTDKRPIQAGFTGNAYQWWDANIKSGKYKYGTTPKVGALAVWKSSLANSGGCGHVAIVEEIKNNKVYISESAWHGALFKYKEIYNTGDLYGYVYIDEPNY